MHRVIRTQATAAQAAGPSTDEVQKSYAVLQNGSDVRGFAIGGMHAAGAGLILLSYGAVANVLNLASSHQSYAGVEGEDLNLTAESAYFMGQAFTDMVEKQLGKPSSQLRISVGARSQRASLSHAAPARVLLLMVHAASDTPHPLVSECVAGMNLGLHVT